MSARLQSIIRHWNDTASAYVLEARVARAKRFRVNLRKAATAATEAADLLAEIIPKEIPKERSSLADDIERLRKAAALLNELGGEFEVAQEKCQRAQKAAAKKAEDESEARIKAVVLELFGPEPDPEAVLSMGADLVLFDRSGVDEFARMRCCQRGLLDGYCDYAPGLHWLVSSRNVAGAARALARARIDCRGAGRRGVVDRDGVSYWHAGWDNFIAWREIRKEQAQARSLPADFA